MDFTGKQVLITGASRGIGFAAAQEFLALGARVAVNGRTEQSVATAIAELGGGDHLIAAPGSVGTVDGCESIVRAAIEGLGGLDVLVNNAGVSIDATIEGGVVNLTRAMAMELAPNIRVNCVCPGWVDTDMLRRDYVDLADDPAAAEREAIEEAPLKRVATPEEIAKAIAYLASHDARFITGVALPIDGGGSAGH
jgi:NAD(P)-dependent dehydrogenase (short-subunit alcohol dehydrogenase family)